MKTLLALTMLSLVLSGCGYGMKCTKSIPPLPLDISDLKVMEIEDIKRTDGHGEYIGKGAFVRNILINQLKQSGPLIIDDNSPYQLILKIEDYNPPDKYVALSAQILDISMNQIVWKASISGQGKGTIDQVVRDVVIEIVKAMVKREKPDWAEIQLPG